MVGRGALPPARIAELLATGSSVRPGAAPPVSCALVRRPLGPCLACYKLAAMLKASNPV